MGLALFAGLLVYAVIATWTLRLVGKLANVLAMTATTKKIFQSASAVIFVLVPTWDIIPGWLYFEYLCNKQAEIRVLKTVDLEAKYFLSAGQADGQKVGHLFKGVFSTDKQFLPLFKIEKRESLLEDSRSGEVLGTTKEFVYRGGWVTRLVLPDATYLCRQYQSSSAHMVLWREVIRPKKDVKDGGN